MVKIGLDTYEEPINQSALNGGWTPQGYVTGISLMHESGTGGGPKYGFPAQMPLTSIGGGVNLLDNKTYWQKRVSTEMQNHWTNESTKFLTGRRRQGKCRLFPNQYRVGRDNRTISIAACWTVSLYIPKLV